MKKLLIDIPALLESGESAKKIECEYLYHRKNSGPLNLLEVAEFGVYCRKCKEAFCVSACPKDAIEHLDSGLIKRFNMRCVGCKSCVLACPFGTVFPEVMDYISSKCDFCLDQLNNDPNYEPVCVKTSPQNSFSMKEFSGNAEAKEIFFIGDHLAVKSHNWLSKENKR